MLSINLTKITTSFRCGAWAEASVDVFWGVDDVSVCLVPSKFLKPSNSLYSTDVHVCVEVYKILVETETRYCI